MPHTAPYPLLLLHYSNSTVRCCVGPWVSARAAREIAIRDRHQVQPTCDVRDVLSILSYLNYRDVLLLTSTTVACGIGNCVFRVVYHGPLRLP